MPSLAAHRSWKFVTLLMLIALTTSLRAADDPPVGPLDRKAMEESLYHRLGQILVEGADIFNGGNQAGAAYLFRGALVSIEPLFDHNLPVQRMIAKGLADAKAMPRMGDRAWALRDLIVTLRHTLQPSPQEEIVTGKGNTLWERMGGERNVKKIIHDAVEAAVADPRVNFFRNGKNNMSAQELAAVESRMVDMASDLSRGPHKYTGKTMKDAHKGMNITDDEFDAFVAKLKMALMRNRVLQEDVAFILAAVGSTRKDIVLPAPEVVGQPKRKSMWERLGGEANVKKIMHEFMEEVLADPKVNFLRGGKFNLNAGQLAALEAQLVDMASSVSGGPRKYTGKTMKEVHRGMGITAAEFDALIAHLKIVLLRNNVQAVDVELVVAAAKATQRDIVEKSASAQQMSEGDLRFVRSDDATSARADQASRVQPIAPRSDSSGNGFLSIGNVLNILWTTFDPSVDHCVSKEILFKLISR